MDQDAFFETCREIGERDCLYEKGILANQCVCSQASRLYVAEREVVHCRSNRGHTRCGELLILLRRHAMFALKTAGDSSTLSHAKSMRVQIGGLRGLQIAMHQEQPTPSPPLDVYRLIEQAIKRFQNLEKLPFHEIIRQITAYRGRKKRSRR